MLLSVNLPHDGFRLRYLVCERFPLYGGDPDPLSRELSHVRFIGGGSGSGKTTIARRLAAEHGLRLYHTEPFSKYVARTTPEDAPLLHAFLAMDMDERWLNRSPTVMRDTFHAFRGETFHLVIDDLLQLPMTPAVLVEGFLASSRRS